MFTLDNGAGVSILYGAVAREPTHQTCRDLHQPITYVPFRSMRDNVSSKVTCEEKKYEQLFDVRLRWVLVTIISLIEIGLWKVIMQKQCMWRFISPFELHPLLHIPDLICETLPLVPVVMVKDIRRRLKVSRYGCAATFPTYSNLEGR